MSINKALGLSDRLLNNIPEELKAPKVPVKSEPEDVHQNLEDDYKLARENIRYVISQSSEVLDVLKDVSISTEHARLFEVYANLMSTMVDANKDLVDLTIKQKEIAAPKNQEPGNVTNNTFIGTTDDLLKLLKGDSSSMKDVTPNETDS